MHDARIRRQGFWHPLVPLVVCCASLVTTLPANAADAISQLVPFSEQPGSLVIVGGGPLPYEIRDRFMALAGGTSAELVVITTASVFADNAAFEERIDFWKDYGPKSFRLLHTRNRRVADQAEFSKCLETATAVWIVGGNQAYLSETYLDTLVERRLRQLLDRGGVIGGTSAGAAAMSRTMICGGLTKPLMGTGFGFLPNTVVDQHFMKRGRIPRLMAAVGEVPGAVGLGIDEATAVIVTGRTMEVLGEACVTICLPATPNRGQVIKAFPNGTKTDLVAYSRAAIARAMASRPQKRESPPNVTDGTMLVVGPGPTPGDAATKFIAAAGGAKAPLVVLGTGLANAVQMLNQKRDLLVKAGAENVQIYSADTTADLTRPELRKLLESAMGIWLSGGEERHLIEVYGNDATATLFRNVLSRGGVVAGDSAAAAIQGEYLLSASTDAGTASQSEEQQEGYELGLGLLQGVAIQDGNTAAPASAEIRELQAKHPQMVALGLGTSSAVLMQGSTMEVVGETVEVFAQQQVSAANTHEPLRLKAGEKLDFRRHFKSFAETPAGSLNSR